MACSTKASNSASLRPATSRSLLKWRGAGIWGVTIRTDAGGGAGAAGAAEELWTGAGMRGWSRRFGGGDGEGVVAEAGDEVEFAAESLHVAGDGVDGGQFATFDLRDPAGGDAHDLGELGLGEAVAFAFFGEPLAALPGHECLAAAFGFFLTADAVDVGGAVPFGVTGHRPDSSSSAR